MDVETVVVVRPPAKGKFGDPVTGSAVEFTIPGCLYAPGGSSENNTDANSVDTTGELYIERNVTTGVKPTDRIRIRGHLFEVVGEPAVWGTFGTVIRVRRFAG